VRKAGAAARAIAGSFHIGDLVDFAAQWPAPRRPPRVETEVACWNLPSPPWQGVDSALGNTTFGQASHTDLRCERRKAATHVL
jgi:hypothetical protein